MANIVLNKVSSTCPIYDIKAAVALDQGNLVVLGTQDTATNVGVYTVAACGAITDAQMAIVACVPILYTAESVQGDFQLAIGEIGRAYQPYVGLTITVENAQLTATATAVAGRYVIPDASALKMEIVASLGGTEAVVFVLDEATTINGVASSKIRCIKA